MDIAMDPRGTREQPHEFSRGGEQYRLLFDVTILTGADSNGYTSISDNQSPGQHVHDSRVPALMSSSPDPRKTTVIVMLSIIKGHMPSIVFASLGWTPTYTNDALASIIPIHSEPE